MGVASLVQEKTKFSKFPGMSLIELKCGAGLKTAWKLKVLFVSYTKTKLSSKWA